MPLGDRSRTALVVLGALAFTVGAVGLVVAAAPDRSIGAVSLDNDDDRELVRRLAAEPATHQVLDGISFVVADTLQGLHSVEPERVGLLRATRSTRAALSDEEVAATLLVQLRLLGRWTAESGAEIDDDGAAEAFFETYVTGWQGIDDDLRALFVEFHSAVVSFAEAAFVGREEARTTYADGAVESGIVCADLVTTDDEATIDLAVAALDRGIGWDEVRDEFSVADPGTRSVIGEFGRCSTRAFVGERMLPAFVRAADATAVGDVSDPFRTVVGSHLMRSEEFDDVPDDATFAMSIARFDEMRASMLSGESVEVGDWGTWHAEVGVVAEDLATVSSARPVGPTPLIGAPSTPAAASISPDGRWVALGRDLDGNSDVGAGVWDAETGELVWRLLNAGDGGDAVAFSHNGNLVAATTTAGIGIWDLTTGPTFRSFAPAAADLVPGQLAFSADDRLLLMVERDGSRVELWDLLGGQYLTGVDVGATSIELAGFVADGTAFVTATAERVERWSMVGESSGIIRLVPHTWPDTLNPSGSVMLTSGDDTAAIALTPELVARGVAPSSADDTGVAFETALGDRRMALWATPAVGTSPGGMIEVQDVASGDVVSTFEMERHGHLGVMSADDETLVFESAVGPTEVVDLVDGSTFAELLQFDRFGHHLIDPTGSVVVGRSVGRMAVWNVDR